MNARDLFTELCNPNSEWFIPLEYMDSNEDFLGFILGKIQKYVNLVKGLNVSDVHLLNSAYDALPLEIKPKKKHDFMRDLQAVADITHKVLQISFRSFHEEAFDKLRNFFEADDSFYLYMFPQLHLKQGLLYRIRNGVIKQNATSDGEMFHIPFEKRYLVNTQRFSILGYPALYLAGSFFTAWCELDKPPLDGLTYVYFKPKTKMIFLDLGLPYSQSPEVWELYGLFVMYPILMACMTRVKYPNAPFKPEYLMPQLMMKIVREHTSLFRGISYVSNKIPYSSDRMTIDSRNFVLCVNNTICSSGHDEDLARSLQISDFKHISIEQIKKSVTYNKGKYSIEFNQLDFSSRDVHDLKIKMQN